MQTTIFEDFRPKRKIETHKIRLYGPFKILPGPKNLIKLDHIFVHWFDIVQFEWRMGISDWNWLILRIWLAMKRYKWFILFTFFQRSKKIETHDANFQTWNCMYIANPKVYFREFDGFMKKLFWQLHFFVGSQGWSPGMESYDEWLN